jgi:DNA-binding transcriptional ArsR family regulator
VNEPIPHPVPPELATLIAGRFRLLADATRIRLLDALRDGPATVGELQRATGHSQQNVSKHLGVLHGAGMLHRTKEGTSARYAIADEGVFTLCEHVCGGLRRHVDHLESLLQGAQA